MKEFLFGFFSSLAATGAVAVLVKWAWPEFQNRCIFKGIRVAGPWDIIEEQKGKQVNVGRLELKQTGRKIRGTSLRSKRRDGSKSHRTFDYSGHIDGNQVTLLFEDSKGVGFDPGTYVFLVQNDGNTMVGMATFHGKPENRIVSEGRTLRKATS